MRYENYFSIKIIISIYNYYYYYSLRWQCLTTHCHCSPRTADMKHLHELTCLSLV